MRAALIEVSTCLRLFGGLANLLMHLLERLETLHIAPMSTPALATCCTGTGAWWLLKTRPIQTVDHLQQHLDELNHGGQHLELSMLADLPVQVLDCKPQALRLMEQCGLLRIRDLQQLPRDNLLQRFGAALVGEMDAALGAPVLLHPPEVQVRQPLEFKYASELPFHTQQQEAIERHALRALEKLQQWLDQHQRSARSVQWLFRTRHDTLPLILRSAQPRHEAKVWASLLHHRLSRVPFCDEVRSTVLECADTEPRPMLNHSLLHGSAEAHAEPTRWASTCDLLKARLGDEAVLYPQRAPDPRPEQSTLWSPAPANKRQPDDLPAPHPATSTPRPLWLLPAPKPLEGPSPGWSHEPQARQGWQLLSGPERIDFGWWDQAPCRRDYYWAVHRQRAQQVWIFQDLQEPGQPWFLHGVFA